MTCNWMTNDYLSELLHKDARTHVALEMLVDDIHTDKERTLANFLCHSGSEDFLWGLARLLANDNPRVAGNAAYIVGTLAESDLGCYRVLSLTKTPNTSQQILQDLTNMLTFDDVESVMNAAGTMGTLAESYEGRLWMLGEPCFDRTIEKITALLNNKNMWTASNAALVLARISISEEGCNKILKHELSTQVLAMLIASLGTDEAGRGMNAAFAIGRICDSDAGRNRLLALSESERMISCLAKMLGCGDLGSSKNACFALSCLAASSEGHARLLNNALSDDILTELSTLLSAADPETAWFSAMTLRTMAAQAKGCVRLRECQHVLAALKAVLECEGASDDLCSEVRLTLDILKRLERPATPTVEVIGSTTVKVKWEKITSKSGLEVMYQLCENNKSVYRGQNTSHTITTLTPHQAYQYKLRVITEGDDSPYSDCVSIQTEEDVPTAPIDLHISGVTSTQLKVTWESPAVMNGETRGYYVFLGDVQIEHTHDTTVIISSLTPSTSYIIQVCGGTSKGKGERASVEGCTAEEGAHCPLPPTVTVLGRYEVHIVWKPPDVPLGRITRYDVTANGKPIYSGTELSYTERRLSVDTEYAFIVSALTNEGRFDSKPTRKRTAKDEYDVARSPLYQPPIPKKEDETKANDLRRRKSTSFIESKDSSSIRMSSACSHKKDSAGRPISGQRERRRKSEVKKFDDTSLDKQKPRSQKSGQSTSNTVTKNDAVPKIKPPIETKAMDNPRQKQTEYPKTETDIKPVKPEKANSPETTRASIHHLQPNVLETAKTCLTLPYDAERRRGNLGSVDAPKTPASSASRATLESLWGATSLKLSTPKGAMEFYQQYEETGKLPCEEGRRHSMPVQSRARPHALKPLPHHYYTRVAQLMTEGHLSLAQDLLHRSSTNVSLRSSMNRESIVRNLSRQSSHSVVQPIGAPVQPTPWAPSVNALPDNRLSSLGNKFVPMQFRTQPANLSVSSIQRMNTQVLDNDISRPCGIINYRTQLCCNGQVYARVDRGTQCCGNGVYDARAQICCRGEAKPESYKRHCRGHFT